MVGHVDGASARLLFRPAAESQTLRLRVLDESTEEVGTFDAVTSAEDDYVAKFHVPGLKPATRYTYRITRIEGGEETVAAEGPDLSFRTASLDRSGGRVTACFTSCVDIEENPMWADIGAIDPDTLFLMGDTPYIDSSDLGVVRKRHRDFLAMPGLRELVRHIPTVGTWDDHDFGRNNGNGLNMAEGKGRTRRGFVEYRAHGRYGDGEGGVYHSVDLGMMEVFLLDPRYFSQTEPSPVDPSQPTCFGKGQWEWLLRGLSASKAPFKVLAMGAIWQDKKNSETDDMFTYWYERDALLDFAAEQGIEGVVLLGGDIHVARHLVHPLRLGYDLHDFVISPGHSRTITSLDVFHPSLRWSLVEGQQFLSMTADGTLEDPTLVVRFSQGGRKVNREVVLPLSGLKPRKRAGLARDLRAHWTFDDGFAQSGPLGETLDAVPHGSPSIARGAGRFGGAVRLERSRSQFLSVPGAAVDDNSDEHSVALWIKPSGLPEHGTAERQFLLESTAEGKPSQAQAWHLSVGLRACADPELVNLQLYTHTLRPAAAAQGAPTSQSQGPFDCPVPRSTFDRWTQVAAVFDSKSWTLYVNGEQAAVHTLPMPGPASEMGGLILGGHREGTGRGFDGWLDEVAIWARALSGDEIRSLVNAENSPLRRQ